MGMFDTVWSTHRHSGECDTALEHVSVLCFAGLHCRFVASEGNTSGAEAIYVTRRTSCMNQCATDTWDVSDRSLAQDYACKGGEAAILVTK